MAAVRKTAHRTATIHQITTIVLLTAAVLTQVDHPLVDHVHPADSVVPVAAHEVEAEAAEVEEDRIATLKSTRTQKHNEQDIYCYIGHYAATVGFRTERN